VEAAIATAVDIHKTKGTGDILIFLTGQDEVDDAAKKIEERCQGGRKPPHVLPMYGALPAMEQLKVCS
jgi:HrpA-like RNA helicase